ncbi:membrane-associated guanylate kinase, WW and PDZ domain-containing protein 1-like [Danio aesculapii]|uniref:membrane-associated guanylate kinase, WW and PDZ domain-containing protein 1-like n=1 Tax=Danio aesculapii TaxID=1142201 RepID=UPI0024BFD582|nr:membrane-associated guanylate kinase, WW and PDZ domain-containing protein 1-like [Danio aesculapii]
MERESAVWRGAGGRLPLAVSGGSESGQFLWVRPLSSSSPPELLLELQGLRVSGLPLYALLELLEICGDPLRIRTATARGRLKKGLRYYLSLRFQKHSVDHQLQETIRDNLYRYSTPCETHTHLLCRARTLFSIDTKEGLAADGARPCAVAGSSALLTSRQLIKRNDVCGVTRALKLTGFCPGPAPPALAHRGSRSPEPIHATLAFVVFC